jgi:hypothetical protein
MRRLKISLGISWLTLALALLGCVAPQPYQQIRSFDQERWNSVMVPEPSAQNTNMQLWNSMQGGG